jgi:hypothetical protein
MRTRTSLLQASRGSSFCPEKKNANEAAYDGGPYE